MKILGSKFPERDNIYKSPEAGKTLAPTVWLEGLIEQGKWLEDWKGGASWSQVKKLCLEGTEKLRKKFNDISLLASQPIIYLE